MNHFGLGRVARAVLETISGRGIGVGIHCEMVDIEKALLSAGRLAWGYTIYSLRTMAVRGLLSSSTAARNIICISIY